MPTTPARDATPAIGAAPAGPAPTKDEATKDEATKDDATEDAATCVVCRIVSGDLEAQVVFRDETLVAFLDHRPVFPGHVLVCPVEHVPDLNHLDTALMQPLMAMAQRVSLAQQQVLEASGSFVALNNIVSQSVPHVHVHVVPRRFKDGLRGFFWPRTRYAPGQDAEVAALLRGALAPG